ncbi:TolC family protein [Botrimarina mediterranea]|uniref:TolC family protein n=1 Tax=Botrimarina mediterranea TaxID=2528022 RepID=UPI001189CF1B|nr:Outer membrane efflux protein [Planctomycetes bacterium K2D]
MDRRNHAKTAAILLLSLPALVGAVGCQQAPKRSVAITATHGMVPPAAVTIESAKPSQESGVSASEEHPNEFSTESRARSVQLAQHTAAASGEEETTALRLPATKVTEELAPAGPTLIEQETENVVAPPPSSTPTPTGQSVESLVDNALSGHPRVRAARARVAAASNRAPQVTSLEDPTLTNTFYPIADNAIQTAGGRVGDTLAVSQKYPWPAKRWTKGAIADRETQMAAAKLAQVELEIEEMVRLAYYELWFADRAIAITNDNREIAAELVKLAEARNAAGGSQQDILRAQLQLDNLDDRLIGLRRQKAIAQADLAALIQQPNSTGIEPTAEIEIAEVPQRLDALFAAAQECSPRLRERQWAVSRDRQKQRLAALNTRPDFMLGAGWQSISESAALSPVANGHDNISFMVGVTLPIWRDRINASIREASADVAASAREFDDAQDDTFRQIRRLTEQAYAADEQLSLYNDRILPRSRRALQLSAADYRGKLVDFGEVASGFTEVLMFELQVARAKATLAGTLAQLDRAVGCEVSADGY